MKTKTTNSARPSRRAGIQAQEARVLELEVVGPQEVELAKHAGAIRALGKRVVTDIIAIGQHLIAAKKACGHGSWEDWLKREFEWSQSQAARFMSVAEWVKSSVARDLPDLSIDSLYLLSRPSTSEEAREAVIEKAQNGKLTHVQVKKLVAEAEAKEAAQQEKRVAAIEQKHARLVEQRDGKIKELQEELEGALTPKEVDKAVKEALKPYEERLALYKEELKELRGKGKPRKPDTYGLVATNLSYALNALAEAAQHVTPEQVKQAQQLVSDMTGRPLKKLFEKDAANAEIAKGWLENFLTMTGGL